MYSHVVHAMSLPSMSHRLTPDETMGFGSAAAQSIGGASHLFDVRIVTWVSGAPGGAPAKMKADNQSATCAWELRDFMFTSSAVELRRSVDSD